MPPKEDAGARLRRRLVRRDGCLEWTGATRNGYGAIRVGLRLEGTRRVEYTHRLAWLLAHGPIPDGLMLCHRCDNTLCCDTRHMFLGTAKENSHDAISKGRWRGPEDLTPRALRWRSKKDQLGA